MKVPFVDLKKQYLSIKNEVNESIKYNLINTQFIGGKDLVSFKKNLSDLLGLHAVPVANGTDAIYISLKMLGIGRGDEVITTAHSWISTSETISQTGAKPIFVDTNEFFCIDESLIEEKITKKTKAIIPVHLYGHSANMDVIMKIAKKYKLVVIEDCAQAILTKWKDKFVGSYGDAGTISFFPGKNLGAYGDAGGIVTRSSRNSRNFSMFANHGGLKKHDHKIEGINSRMDNIQAGILNVKIKYIKDWIEKRRKAAKLYSHFLSDLDSIELPLEHQDCYHSFHLFVIKTKKRNQLINYLSDNGVSTGIHYPNPLPLLDCYKTRGYTKSDFPNSYANSKQILSLPLFPEITEKQIDYVSKKVKKFFG